MNTKIPPAGHFSPADYLAQAATIPEDQRVTEIASLVAGSDVLRRQLKVMAEKLARAEKAEQALRGGIRASLKAALARADDMKEGQ